MIIAGNRNIRMDIVHIAVNHCIAKVLFEMRNKHFTGNNLVSGME
jgi:hypothetical protein